MKRPHRIPPAPVALAALALVFVASAAPAQTRTPWEQHEGLEVTTENPLGLVEFSCSPSVHGDVCEYDVAMIPPADDPGWGPAPDPDIIAFSIHSRVCDAPVQCLAYGDFTYFQTFVTVPAGTTVDEFTIAFSGMDDGSRITIFNDDYPAGIVVEGSYVFLGGSGTADLADFVRTGQNRVVVTQVDDCCSGNNLGSAVVVLNGETVGVEDICPDSVAMEGDVKAKLALKFKAPQKDKLQVKAKGLVLPDTFALPADVRLNVGGSAIDASLDEKGKWKSASGGDKVKLKESKKDGTWKLSAKRKNADLASALLDEGLANEDNPKPGKAVSVGVCLSADGENQLRSLPMTYKSKQGKVGKAK